MNILGLCFSNVNYPKNDNYALLVSISSGFVILRHVLYCLAFILSCWNSFGFLKLDSVCLHGGTYCCIQKEHLQKRCNLMQNIPSILLCTCDNRSKNVGLDIMIHKMVYWNMLLELSQNHPTIQYLSQCDSYDSINMIHNTGTSLFQHTELSFNSRKFHNSLH